MIGVLGAGAWGTALAAMLAADGTPVTLWTRRRALAEEINARRANATYLPGQALPAAIRATADLGGMTQPVLLAVVPSAFLGGVLVALPRPPRDLVLCAKGLADDGALVIDLARGSAAQLAVLSGPTFAREVAAGLPTAVTLACAGGTAQWDRLAPLIARGAFRPYYSDDCVGAEIGGVVKNVLAIACGVVAGLRLGENARAALIARGHAEMLRFGLSRGARAETLGGLSGLGDLVLTCASPASRNYALGEALGAGASAAEALAGKASVAEGARTAPILAALARRDAIAMPITDAVARLLAGEVTAPAMAAALLARPLRAEAAAA